MRRTGCADALWALEALRGTLELFDGAPEGAPVLPAAPSQMEELWKNSGGFGFNLSAAVKPSMIEEFVEHVVPILQKRGIVRTDYSGNTLRDHLNS